MYNIDKTIKQLNTALVLGDGHEFTIWWVGKIILGL